MEERELGFYIGEMHICRKYQLRVEGIVLDCEDRPRLWLRAGMSESEESMIEFLARLYLGYPKESRREIGAMFDSTITPFPIVLVLDDTNAEKLTNSA